MFKIKHLDCTLRDGGYYNNWDFKDKLINKYLKVISDLDIDYCEIGFRFYNNSGFRGSCAFSSEEFLSSLEIPENLKIAVMINANEFFKNKELNIQLIKKLFPISSKNSKIDMVRVACHSETIEKTLPIFEFLSDKGYFTACNITQISDKTDKALKEIGALINTSKVDVLYFADSLGSVSPTEIENIVRNLKTYWEGQLGIHAHDNKGLALSNTLKAIDCKVDWVDSTITGIGRGPGNVKTEELIIELNNKNKNQVRKDINLVPLIKLVNDDFTPMKNKYKWGTNIFYYLAGQYSIHPSYIQSMLSDYRYREEDILASINYLKEQGGRHFDFNDLNETRKFYKGNPIGTWDPKTLFRGRDVLIIGTGSEFENHEKAVELFIKKLSPVVLAINTKKLSNNSLIDLRVACHPTRLFADVEAHLNLPEPLAIPLSMLPKEFRNIFKGKDIRDFGIGLSKDKFEFHDTYCMIPNSLVISYALALVTSGKVNNIYLAGFDGYGQGDSRNDEVNELLFKFKQSQPSTDVIAITPTKFKNLTVKSVYGI